MAALLGRRLASASASSVASASALASPLSPSLSPPLLAAYSTLRTYGGLKDQDRIFTNLYGKHDFGIKGALKRVRPNGEGADGAEGRRGGREKGRRNGDTEREEKGGAYTRAFVVPPAHTGSARKFPLRMREKNWDRVHVARWRAALCGMCGVCAETQGG